MLEHKDSVRHAESQGPSGSPLADHHGDRGNSESSHLAKVHGNRLGLAALFGTDAGVGARGVDERHDGAAELLSESHEPQRLAVSLGMGHAEVAAQVLLHVAALLVADDHDRAAVETSPSPHDGGIVTVHAVAV